MDRCPLENRKDFKIQLWGISEAIIQEPIENFLGSGKGPITVRDHGFICDDYSPAVLRKISPPEKLERQSAGSI